MEDFVSDELKQTWQELCARAATEQEPEKLIELVRQINRLLEKKQAGLKQNAEQLGIKTANRR
jgi:hypothetical protein